MSVFKTGSHELHFSYSGHLCVLTIPETYGLINIQYTFISLYNKFVLEKMTTNFCNLTYIYHNIKYVK